MHKTIQLRKGNFITNSGQAMRLHFSYLMLLSLDRKYCNCRLWICWRLPYSSDQNTKRIFNKSLKTWHSDVINKLVYIVPITRLRSIKYVFPVPSFMTDISALIFEFRFCLKYYFARIIKETKILKAYLKEINTNNITNRNISIHLLSLS